MTQFLNSYAFQCGRCLTVLPLASPADAILSNTDSCPLCGSSHWRLLERNQHGRWMAMPDCTHNPDMSDKY